MDSQPASSSKQRMRLYRERRRRGMRHVGILIDAPQIKALVRKGYLASDLKYDADELQFCVSALLDDALDNPT